MNTKKFILLIVLGALLLVLSLSTAVAQNPRSYLVVVKNNASATAVANQIAARGGIVTSVSEGAGIVGFKAANASPAAGVNGVRSVVPNLVFQFTRPVREVALEEEYANPPNSGDNDTRFDLQWGHDAVNAVEAWNRGVRGAGAVVAVLDGGFDLDHPDLAPNIIGGMNFVDGETLSYALPDPFSHGSHVAGTIAAADNGFGVIGVAPEAKLVVVKVLGDGGSGSFEDVIEGIVWAANQDVDIINMSLGADLPQNGGCFGPDDCITAREVAELKVAVQKAVNYAHQQGTLVIVSAGNDGRDADKDKATVVLPAGVSNAVAISATAPIGWALNPTTAFLDYPATYTNYGNSLINLAAPGGDSAYPGNELCTIGSLTRPCWVFDLVFSTGSSLTPGVGAFYWSAGTSMAAPHAAGVAALIVSEKGRMHPSQLLAELRARADDLGKPGKDPYYGAGRVNAEAGGGLLPMPPAP